MTIVITTAGDDQFVAEHTTDADKQQQNNNCFGDMFECEDWSPDWNLCGTTTDNDGCWEAFPNDVFCNNKEAVAASSDIADVDAEVAKKLKEYEQKTTTTADDNTANVGKDTTTPPTDVIWLNDNMAAGPTTSPPTIVSGMDQLQQSEQTKTTKNGDDATVITTAETIATHLTAAKKYAYKGACGAYKEGNDCLTSLSQTLNQSTCHQSLITSTMGCCNMLDAMCTNMSNIKDNMCNDMSGLNDMVTCQIFPCGDESEEHCNAPCGNNKVDATSDTTKDVAAAVEEPTEDVPVEPTEENVAGETF